jgi:hypothetical protein
MKPSLLIMNPSLFVVRRALISAGLFSAVFVAGFFINGNVRTLAAPTATAEQTGAPSARSVRDGVETWSGQISDSICGAKHEEAAEGQGKMADRDCTLSCVRGGSKYVLVAEGKVLQISNQDFKDLETHAGHKVKMTGEMKGSSILVSKIEMQ